MNLNKQQETNESFIQKSPNFMSRIKRIQSANYFINTNRSSIPSEQNLIQSNRESPSILQNDSGQFSPYGFQDKGFETKSVVLNPISGNTKRRYSKCRQDLFNDDDSSLQTQSLQISSFSQLQDVVQNDFNDIKQLKPKFNTIQTKNMKPQTQQKLISKDNLFFEKQSEFQSPQCLSKKGQVNLNRVQSAQSKRSINSQFNNQISPQILHQNKNTYHNQKQQIISPTKQNIAQKYFRKQEQQPVNEVNRGFFNINFEDAQQLDAQQKESINPILEKLIPLKLRKNHIQKSLYIVQQSYKILQGTMIEKESLKYLAEGIINIKKASEIDEKYKEIISSLVYQVENLIPQANEQYEQLLQKNNELETQFHLYKSQLEEKEMEIFRKETELKEKEVQGIRNINSLNKQLSKLKSQNQNMCEQNASLLKELDELENLKIQLSDNQSNYQDALNTIKIQEQQLKDKDNQLNQNILSIKSLQEQVDDLKAKVEKQGAGLIIQNIFQDLQFVKEGEGFSNEQIKNVLEKLNPEVSIEKPLVLFVKDFQNIVQNQPNEDQQTLLQQQNDNLIQQFTLQQQDPQQLPSSQKQKVEDTMQCVLVLQDMYKQDGITTFVTDQTIETLSQESNSKAQQWYLQTGLHNQTSYFQMKISQGSNMYQQLQESASKDQFSEFVKDFKNQIGQKIDSPNPQQDVIILNVKYNDIPQIDFKVNSQALNNSQIKEKLTLDSIGVSLGEKSLLEFAKLSVSMFDPQYNMEWTQKYAGKFETRGQLKFYKLDHPCDFRYYFPVGFKGYALNVDIYGQDKSWISKNADQYTWIPLFHGTNEKAVEGIMNNNLAPGWRNMYGGSKCRITGTLIKKGANANVYLTDEIKIAEKFADKTSSYGGKKYIIIFQCRVNPQGVKSPESKEEYFTVEDNTNIRPYRILLKEIQ